MFAAGTAVLSPWAVRIKGDNLPSSSDSEAGVVKDLKNYGTVVHSGNRIFNIILGFIFENDTSY